MAEQIRLIPERLRAAADRHRRAADYLITIPLSHNDIQASLDSLGPVYGGLRDAGRQLLEARRRCYEGQAADHSELADDLDAVAALWECHEQESATAFRTLTEDLTEDFR